MAIIPADEKVFMVDKRTNTIYGGSKALQDMQQWYTMQDVSDSIQPYKVFTALLTQSGGDNRLILDEGDLTIGVTYQIRPESSGSYDFTNVGAPNNEIGTYFIATGTTPNSWGSGVLRYNTGAPVVTILENTIGNIFFEYAERGKYRIKSDYLFTLEKTFINGTSFVGNSVFNQFVSISDGTKPGFKGYYFNQAESDEVILNTLRDEGEFADTVLPKPTCIEIRVYN